MGVKTVRILLGLLISLFVFVVWALGIIIPLAIICYFIKWFFGL